MRFYVLALVSCLAASYPGVALALSPANENGFVPLFNARDIAGWKRVGTGEWTVDGGELTCDGKGSGWLRTDKMYRNFVLRLEWQIAPRGNSGVFIHAPEKGRSSRLGFEIQILDDSDKPADKNSTGSIYDILPPSQVANRPAGEWNSEEIVCDGARITVTLNGKKVQDFRTDDPAINAKQDEIHKPSLRRKVGYIGLQNHGAVAKFRNIRLKELPD